MIYVTSRQHEGCEYWINPAQIVKIWREEDGLTRLETVDGKIIYPNEDPLEIVDEIRRIMKK